MTDDIRPTEGYRAISWPSEYRDDAGRPPRLVGHFARFNVPNEIDSAIEGQFMEIIEPGAFARTFKNNRDRIRVLFQHGKDPDIGEKPIAAITDLRSDNVGPAYEAELLDGIPPLVLDGLKRGQYGVSYRFSVSDQKWNDNPGKSPANPKGLPERVIREARVYEFGPVTFPADAGADVAVRSLTDEMRPITPTEPVAPSAEPEAPEPHPEPEARDEPVEPIAVPTPQENSTVEYITREEKVSRIEEIKRETATLGTEYPGVMPAEPQARWDGLVKEQDALQADVNAWDTRQARIEANMANTRMVETPVQGAPFNVIRRKSEADVYDVDSVLSDRGYTLEERSQALRDNAMRAVETASFPISDRSRTQERISALIDYADVDDEIRSLILRTGSPIYRRAFPKALLGRAMTPEEQRAVGAVNVLATGGYAVPFQFDTSIIGIGAHTAVSPYRAACRVVTIAGTNTWEPLTATAMTAAFAAEAAAAVDSTPTFARPTFQLQTARAFSQVSMELLQDRPDLVSELGTLIGEAKDTLEETKFSLGAGVGSNEPLGMFINATFTNIDSVANDAIDVGDPEKVEAGLGLRHRANAAWFMARKTIRAYQALETTGGKLFGGQYYNAVGLPSVDSPTGNTGLKLLGYPIWEVPSAPTGVADGTITAVFGDPSKYAIVDRLGLTVEYVPHLVSAAGNLPIGARGIFAYWRTMGGRIDVNGMLSMSVQ